MVILGRVLRAVAVTAVAAVAVAGVPTVSSAATPVVTVDLSSSRGAVNYSAAGMLHGLSQDGSPTDDKLSGLRMQNDGAVAPDGLQHPDGHSLNIAPEFYRNNGAHVLIYMQDIYAQWPYPKNGMNDYLSKINTMVAKVKAAPNASKFVYVPFNEPDWIWYGTSGQLLTDFQNDWKTVYQRIRSLDPSAVIAGPNMLAYNSSAYRSFYTFAKNNGVLPNVTTWHELDGSLFGNWYSHYDNYRQIERDLGIGALPINIDEYGRSSGDMGIPGQMIQYIARFDASGVSGCMSAWGAIGDMDMLLTGVKGAKASAWYLFRWYGEMTGNRMNVSLPSREGSLQAIASLDTTNRRQASVILGGASGSAQVVLKGIGSTSLGSTVHVVVSALANSNRNASNGPTTVTQGDYGVSGGQITVNLSNLAGANAYQIVVTSGTGGALNPNATYRLGNVNSGKLLDDSGFGALDGAAVVQWTASGGVNQGWALVEAGGGYYKIVNRYSGKALDDLGNATADGASIAQWTYNATNNQLWSVTSLGSGRYRILNKFSGKALAVQGGSTADGGAVVQTGYTGATSQQWTIS